MFNVTPTISKIIFRAKDLVAEKPHLKITVPSAVILAAIIGVGTFFSNVYTDKIHSAYLTDTVKSHTSQIALNTDRLTRIETQIHSYCDDIASIKVDLKEIRRDQMEYYKSRGFYPRKENGGS